MALYCHSRLDLSACGLPAQAGRESMDVDALAISRVSE